MENKTNIKADEGKQDLLITREFDLPVDLLFQAYTDPDCIEQWMGTKVLKLDCQRHGSYLLETSYQGKVAFRAHGTIHNIIPNQQIVRTFEMEQMPIGVQLELLQFEALNEHTSKLTMQVIYQSENHRTEQLKMPFAYGINMAHNQLQQIMTQSSSYKTNTP